MWDITAELRNKDKVLVHGLKTPEQEGDEEVSRTAYIMSHVTYVSVSPVLRSVSFFFK